MESLSEVNRLFQLGVEYPQKYTEKGELVFHTSVFLTSLENASSSFSGISFFSCRDVNAENGFS